ncbi:MAG: glycosyltransferase [Spirochaetes bacterium]|nr:glycosyltransferase [Spirochaetota bacterium]
MPDKKHIVFYCDVLIYGGHEMMCAEMAGALAKRHTVSFVHCNPGFTRNLGATVRQIRLDLRTPGTGLLNLYVMSRLDISSIKKIFNALQPDIIVICQGEFRLCLKGAIAGLVLKKCPVVSYIPNGYPYTIMDGGVSAKIKAALYKRLLRKVDGFITISVEQETLIRDFLRYSKPVHILENLVEFYAIRKPRSGGRREKRIGIVGRIQPSKGQRMAVGIAERLAQKRTDLRFILFGEGEDSDYLKKVIREKNLDRFFDFRGWVEDRGNIYSSVDLILILSELEGVPLVFLESLYYEKPVLARRLPVNPIYERYVDESFVFSSEEELAEKLLNIESYLARFRKKSAAYRRVVIARHGRPAFEKNLNLIVDRLFETAAGSQPAR